MAAAGRPGGGRWRVPVYSRSLDLGVLSVHFLDRRILLISGKGGVGRTTVTVALARAAARAGKRTLVCEIANPEGGPSAIGRLLGKPGIGPEPIPIADNLHACHLWARSGHEGFLRSVLPGKTLVRAALRSKAVGKFLSAAPSFHEMGVFYHLLSLLETEERGRWRYDLVVLDMPATGHTLALTGLPDILLKLMPGGPIAALLERGQAILNDPKQGAAWVVTLPEQLPVTEAIELLQGLADTRMPAGGVLLNRMPADPFTAAERSAVDGWLDGSDAVFGEVGFRRIEAASEALERLNAAVDTPVLTLPDVPAGEPLEPLTAALARHMAPDGGER